jgi:redox-sensing transcriptional repressor
MLPTNTAERMCKLYGILQSIGNSSEYVSSKELALLMGTTDHTIRKDISALNIMGFTRKGYHVGELTTTLGKALQLSSSYKACIVGLGRLGTALLDYEAFKGDGFEIVAGFDSNTNKIERLRTQVAVYHSSDLDHVVKNKGIEIGIIAVPQGSAQEIATTLVKSGIKGILNFSPVQLKVPKEIVLYNMDFTSALRFVVSQI